MSLGHVFHAHSETCVVPPLKYEGRSTRASFAHSSLACLHEQSEHVDEDCQDAKTVFRSDS